MIQFDLVSVPSTGCYESKDSYLKCRDYCCLSEDNQLSGGPLNRHIGSPPSLILEKINNVKILYGFNVKIKYNLPFWLPYFSWFRIEKDVIYLQSLHNTKHQDTVKTRYVKLLPNKTA